MRFLLWTLVFGLQLALGAIVCFTARRIVAGPPSTASGDIRVAPPAAGPHLVFACDLPPAQLEALCGQPEVIEDLRRIGAGISLALDDLTPARAAVVRRMNQAGIPVTAGLSLPASEGGYLNAGNAPQAAARFDQFQKWTRDNGLQWAGLGLDIEPGLGDFGAALQGHWLRLALTLVGRCFDPGAVSRARNAYAALIRRMEAAGYQVETYQFPFIADGRKAHSTLLERLAGIVDVRAGREVFMTYTSFHPSFDAALIWNYGPEAQALAVGVTNGEPQAGGRFVPLDWRQFIRDVAVASHFSPVVGVYNLDGCVRRGFLARLQTVNWGQPVTIPAEANRGVMALRGRIQAALWTGSHLPYPVAAILLLDAAFIWRRRMRNRRRARPPA